MEDKAKTPSALWDSMTDQQKIEWLAVNVMGWEKDVWGKNRYGRDSGLWKNQKKEIEAHIEVWNPLTDWNHTMEVVDQMMTLGYARKLPDGRDAKPAGHPWITMTTNNTRGWLVNFHWQTDETFHPSDLRQAICKAAFLALQ